MTMGMGGGMGMRHNTAASQSPGGSGMMDFTINGAVFDPARVDITAGAGTIEEWTLQNTSPMDHPVHLHVWPMQLIETQGTAVQEPAWQDVVTCQPTAASRCVSPSIPLSAKPSTTATSWITRI